MRRQLTPVVMDYISVPPKVLKYHDDMMVAIDVMYTKKSIFVVSTKC